MEKAQIIKVNYYIIKLIKILRYINTKLHFRKVWDTDYTTYSLVYNCQQIIPFFLRTDTVYILTRQPSLDNGIQKILYDKLNAKGISINNFYTTKQVADCVY